MIETQGVIKVFDGFWALENVSCHIPEGSIYGMVGSNGAGKSTFMRILAGVYRQDRGTVLIDGAPIYNNPAVKRRVAFVPDELYFPSGANILRMIQMYKNLFAFFDKERCLSLCKELNLDPKKPISNFSKGMKRQAATLLALSIRPDYILFDETFDGLDPVVRNFVKSLICKDVLDRGACAVITSHSLRELEYTCDQLALLHRGGIVVQSEVQGLKTKRFKIQIAFSDSYDKTRFDRIPGIEILHFQKQGSVSNLIVKADREQVRAALMDLHPSVLDILPLSLEEVFTYEMETMGYAFNLS